MKILQHFRRICQFQERVDEDLAQTVCLGGCERCGGRLHHADYDRKPRGGPDSILDRWLRRASFCCAEHGCRKRHTPPSVRFLGRKVYVGVYVVLVAAMMYGPDARRVGQLHAALGIDQRTLRRWRQWWLEMFVSSRFWHSARGRFLPVLDESRMPYSLVDAFDVRGPKSLLRLLRFLLPITTNSWKGVMAF
jgi:hypothetical protein